MPADDVQRRALAAAERALAVAWPYVNGVALDRGVSPWRRETAQESLAVLAEASGMITEALDGHAEGGERR